MNKEIKGIVLKQVQYKEKDSMITVLTSEGVISFLARGILSPTSKNASSCLLYNYSFFYLKIDNNHNSLLQGKLEHIFKNLYENLDNISAVSLMAELTLKFVDNDFDNIFNFFLRSLYLLEEGFESSTVLSIFIAQIIKQSGYDLSFNECVVCGSKKSIVAINYNEGGFICKDCLRKETVLDPVVLKSFRYVFMIDYLNLNHYVLDKEIALNLIIDFCSYLCNCFGEKEIKSLDLYLNVKK